MTKKLILQVLGTSDININGREGNKQFTGSKLEDFRDRSELLRQAFKKQQLTFHFPLLEKLLNTLQPESDLIFGIILTDLNSSRMG